MLVPSAASADDAYNRLRQLILENQPAGTVQTIIKNPEFETLRTPQSEVEDAILFLSKLPQDEASFIRFFSTYAVVPSRRDDTILTLSFVIHSLTGISTDPDAGNAGGYYPLAKREDGKFKSYRRVPGSPTLWWIDLREHNWTPASWEVISRGDGYFAEPIVTADRSGILRLLAGNAVVRADWFIKHSMSTTDQLDVGQGKDFYSTLLYAMSKNPTTIDEWRKAWSLDITKSRSLGNEFATLVTKSNTIASHNRMLFGYRTELGYLYETYDVKNQRGKRDYLESLLLNAKPGQPPEISDAGEAFASNILGLQVYALRNESGKLVDFGDPSVVRHANDIIGDVRVRVAHSCMDCHASGPIPSENTLQEFISSRANIKTRDKRDAIRLKRSLLSDKFRDSISANQDLFAKAVKKVNGLDTVENGSLYLQSIVRYSQPVTLELAAYECGVSVEEFVAAIKKHVGFGARLKLLVQTGEPIPRDIWESPGKDGIPGAFQQAMILINGLTVIKDEVLVERVIDTYVVSEDWEDVPMQSGEEILKIMQSGYELLPTGKVTEGWIEMYTQDGQRGWVQSIHVDRAQSTSGQIINKFQSVPKQRLLSILGE